MPIVTIAPQLVVKETAFSYSCQEEADAEFFRLIVGTTVDFLSDGVPRVITDMTNNFSQTIDAGFAAAHPQFDREYKERVMFMKHSELLAACDEYYVR